MSRWTGERLARLAELARRKPASIRITTAESGRSFRGDDGSGRIYSRAQQQRGRGGMTAETCKECGRVKWEHHPTCSQPWVETPREAWLEEELRRTRVTLDRVRLLADRLIGANGLAHQSAIGQAIHDTINDAMRSKPYDRP